VLAACTRPDTTAPTVALTAPEDSAVLTVGTAVSVTGTAADNVGVKGVAVLVDGVALNTVVPNADGDWSLEWTPAAAGSVELVAKATDAAGNSAESGAVTVTVTAATGSIVGTLTRAPTTFALGAQAAAPTPAPVVPGELFVAFEPGVRNSTFGTTGAGGLSFRQGGGFSFAGSSFEVAAQFAAVPGLALYRAPGLSEAATRDLAERLLATGQVRSAFPNWILSTTAVTPDDTFYDVQAWHYELMNLPEAWEVETGATEMVTVAVLDTGMFDHADVQWGGGGANFAGWDGTAPAEGLIDDPHTLPGGEPHGTHVAGTIGAVTDNGVGVAGVNWNVDILPVKVLGANGSGSFAGILEGLVWVTGEDDPAYGGHVNTTIPRVVNMSLGGNIMGACPSSVNDLFGYMASLGITTVVSAGNDASPADIFFPANCPNVITVGALGPTGARAYYSNFGLQIDVMAPGGDDDYEHPALPGQPAEVLSTVSDGVTESYALMEGTSMAAPHVSGLVSLMVAREPTLTTAQIRARLHGASAPMSLGECAGPVAAFNDFNLCGAGVLDANAALLGLTLTGPTAVVYALPYVDGQPPEMGLGSLPSLGGLATYQVAATPLGDGTYTYSLTGVEPGSYMVVSVETRDAQTSISGVDRVGVAFDVEVAAGGEADADLTGLPLYYLY